MNISKALRDWINYRIQAAAARVAVISKSGRPYEVQGRAGAADEPSYQDPVLLMQHYGFRSRPRPGTEVLTLGNMGFSSQRVAVASETPQLGPTDQVDGEVELYSQGGQRVRLLQDGGLYLVTASGAKAELRPDGSVVLQDSSGGTARLAQGRLTVAADVALRHLLGTGAAPTTVVSATGALAASPGTSIEELAGADRLFRVKLKIGANAINAGVELFTSTFGASLPGGMAQITAEDGTKAKWSCSNSAVTVTAGETLTSGASYVFVVSTGGVA